MKKILITGGAGFIFSNFIRSAIYEQSKLKPEEKQYNFCSIDKITNPNTGLYNRYANKNNHSFHIGDICDTHFIDTIFKVEKPDIIINGAAHSHVDNSLHSPNDFIQSNILGTQVLVSASLKYRVEKFVQISTDECMGQLTSENDKPWTEEAPLNPRNPYSASKAAAELMVQAAGYSHGLNYNITRSSNNYGPRQSPDKLIPKTIKCIMENTKIPIYGRGLQIRDWTHVFDNCAAIMKVIKYGKPNEIYNISANQEYTNIEVVQEICNVMGKGHNLINFIPDPRASHDFRYAINCNKIKQLGWEPEIKFKEGINNTIQWYNTNSYFVK